MLKEHCRDYFTLKYICLRSYLSNSLKAEWGKKRHLLERKMDYVEFSTLSRYSQLLRTPEVDIACIQERNTLAAPYQVAANLLPFPIYVLEVRERWM